MQKVVPETDCLYVRLANDGRRVCIIKSVDGTTITSFCVHECEGSSGRIGARSVTHLHVRTWHLNKKTQSSALFFKI